MPGFMKTVSKLRQNILAWLPKKQKLIYIYILESATTCYYNFVPQLFVTEVLLQSATAFTNYNVTIIT